MKYGVFIQFSIHFLKRLQITVKLIGHKLGFHQFLAYDLSYSVEYPVKTWRDGLKDHVEDSEMEGSESY